MGVSVSQIKRYRKEKIFALRHTEGGAISKSTWGGRRRQHMTFEEEVALLRSLEKGGSEGDYVDSLEIKKIYEKKIGKTVQLSVITRILSRHKWRKISPRKYHPKRDLALQQTFKKTFRKS
jgi:hypothetical protein